MSNEPSNVRTAPRLLIVDDEPGIRELLSEMLLMEGYFTATAATGDEAIQMFREEHYDLALVDLLMPGLSGADVARVFSQERANMPIVIITGSDAGTVEREIGNVRVERILRKPFDMQEVLSVIASLTQTS